MELLSFIHSNAESGDTNMYRNIFRARNTSYIKKDIWHLNGGGQGKFSRLNVDPDEKTLAVLIKEILECGAFQGWVRRRCFELLVAPSRETRKSINQLTKKTIPLSSACLRSVCTGSFPFRSINPPLMKARYVNLRVYSPPTYNNREI